MFVDTTLNEYGVLISEHVCNICGRPFTLCPAKPGLDGDAEFGGCCLATDCPSYDPGRDVDLFWDRVRRDDD